MVAFYFAYGSNMDADRMRTRGAQYTQRKWAVLRGYSLNFNKIATGKRAKPGEGKGNVVPDSQGIVEGVLYAISQDGLRKLDGKEIGYYRFEVMVELDDGTHQGVWTYMAEPNLTRDNLKPTKQYLAYYLKGRDLLSDEYYSRLQAVETLD